ncbi:MAG: tetratricopeptide repeat protein [Ruminococcus sp.]|nr:tetratricopeptide repeat protein [Ruminococcus sp.]
MRLPIQNDSCILLHEIGTDKQYEFRILNTIGEGASCIVYTAVYKDNDGNEFIVRLKEFYPTALNIERNSDNSLNVDNADFQKHLQHFSEGYKKQLDFRKIPDNTNSISNIQGIFEGNNTRYIAMSCQNGISIDEAELSLYDIIRVLKAVTMQIDNFHKNGYLYLDLKPANVILYPETPELVMLFDFDSAVRIEDVSKLKITFTKKWAAPEIYMQKRKEIGVCSDIYTIGALLMYMLFKRCPDMEDNRRSSNWDKEFSESIIADESPEIKRMITDIFRKTLSVYIPGRFKSCTELLDYIEPFILSFQKEKPYLKTSLPLGNNYFCGRDRELNDIHELLQNENFIVLHGIGGIGKSELAKHFALKYSNEYDAVIFVRYVDSIIATVTNDRSFPVVNLSRGDDESDEDYFKRKIGILQKICTPRHLIILDNFDTDECADLDELTSLNCKFLVTSRVDFEDIFPQYEIGVFDEFENLQQLFYHYSKCENAEYSDNIIIALDGHTMAVELVSKQISVNEMSPKDMYEKLCENGIYADENKVKNFKDGSIKSKSAYSHIEVLFSIFGLSEKEKQILRYISLIGTTPMYVEYFNYICEPDEDEMVSFERLVKSGWIQTASDGENSIITPHTLIVDVLCKQLKPDCEHCGKMVYNAAAAAYNIDLNDDADSRKADIYWIDHMAHTISGYDEELAYFYEQMIYPVYMGENMYSKALWAVDRELEILQEIGTNEERLYNAVMFGRAISKLLHNDTEFARFDNMLRELDIDSKSQIILFEEKMKDYINEHNYKGAFNAAEQILEIAKAENNDLLLASAYADMYFIDSTMNEGKDGKKYSEQCTAHIEKYISQHSSVLKGSTDEAADLLADIAFIYFEIEDYSKALEYYLQYEAVLTELQNEAKKMSADSRIADCYSHLNNFEKSAEYYDKALEYAIHSYGDEHSVTADISAEYSNAIILEFNRTNNKELLYKPEEMLQKAIDILRSEELCDDFRINDLMLIYSTVLSQLDMFEESFSYSQKALEFFKNFYGELDPRMARIYLAIGDNYQRAKNREDAENYYRLAISSYKETDLDTTDLKDAVETALNKI